MAARLKTALLLALLPCLLAGCGLAGAGAKQKALYTLDKTKRTLIFTDVHPTVVVPPGFATKLGEAIAQELFQYKAVDHLVAQNRLTELRRDSDRFAKLGVADIARETDSDVVIYIDIITFNVTVLSDDSMTQGLAQVLVKVIDSKGTRLWPTSDVAGTQVDATVDPAFADQQDKESVAKQLNEKLSHDIARLFHDYQANESDFKH